MSISQITDHFTWAEAACHDGTPVPYELRPYARHLASAVLEPLRERWGGPIVVISWYRSPTYNLGVGGKPHSQHLLAAAADVRPAELEALPRFRAVIEDMIHESKMGALGGCGWYPGRWVHLDVRDRKNGAITRWEGDRQGSEP